MSTKHTSDGTVEYTNSVLVGTPTLAGHATTKNFVETTTLSRTADDYVGFGAKGTPVAADRLLIEDSADSWNKKYITLTDLLGGGGGLSGSGAANQVAFWTGTSVLDGDAALLWDGSQISNTTGVLTINPNTYTRIGDAGTSSRGLAADDLYISGELEVDGLVNFDSFVFFHLPVQIFDNQGLTFGDANDCAWKYSTAPGASVGQMRFGVPVTNKTVSIMAVADVNTATSFANTSYPMLQIHGEDEDQWGKFYHDATYFYITTDAGTNLRLNPGTGGTVNVPDDTQFTFGDSSTAAFVWTTAPSVSDQLRLGLSGSFTFSILDLADIAAVNNHSASSPTLFIHGTAIAEYGRLYHDGTDFIINTDSGSKLRFNPGSTYTAVGTGTTSHALGDADFYVTGDGEFDGTLYCDGEATFADVINVGSHAEFAAAMLHVSPVVSASTGPTVAYGDHVLILTSTSTVTVNLTNVNGNIGYFLWVKNASGSANQVDFSNFNTIDGASGTFTATYSSILLYEYNGSGDWVILASHLL